ncbi:hypothetical protein [Thalassotalea maritima]|uniref:hypothetical protein n=1 Tax=Thalassotalea maritima TaxID=3242416 RepID=UPI0035295E94
MTNLNGMTINERLVVMNKIDDFDLAISQNNIEAAIKVLEQCDLTREAAKNTVTAILKEPKKYGY